MSTERTTPTLAHVLERSTAARLEGLNVCMPARIESYDDATCKASVQPLVKRRYVDEAGTFQAEALPVITNVPVVMPGSGGVRVKFPISVGDTVLIMFASCSLDRWLALGGLVDPEDGRRGALIDAIAIPGLQDFANAGEASPMIEFTGAAINAGGSQALALKSDVDNLRTLVGTINTGAPGPLVNTLGPAWLASIPVGTTVLKGA